MKWAIRNQKYVYTSNSLLYFVHVSSIFILLYYISDFNIYIDVVIIGAATHIYIDEVFDDKVSLVAVVYNA